MFFRHGFPRVGSHTKIDKLKVFHGSRRGYAPAAVPRNLQFPDAPVPTPSIPPFAAVSTSSVGNSLPAQTNTTISPSSTMASSYTPSPYRPVPPSPPPIPPGAPPGQRPDSPGRGSGIPASVTASGDPIFGGSSNSSDSSRGTGGASSGLNVPSQSTSFDGVAFHYSSTVAAPGSSLSPGVNVSGGTKESGSKKGAAIAVGVILAFFTLLGFLVLHYRRSRQRRFQTRNHWFFSRKRTSGNHGEKRPTSRARSSWSSFETPIETSSFRSSPPLMPEGHGADIDDQTQVVGYSSSPTDGGTWAQAMRVDPRSNVQQ